MPPEPINLLDYEQLARDKLSRMAYDYYAGGADNAVTLRSNNAAFDCIELYPHVLVDVSQRDTSTHLLGQTVPAPIVVAPMALAGMAHEDAEVAAVQGCDGLPFAVSTLSSRSIEDIAAAASSSPLWFQLYVYRDREITRELVQRAEAAGYQALIVTVDVPLAGNRERDRRNRFVLPENVTLQNFSDPKLAKMMAIDTDSSIATYVANQIDPALTWTDIDWLASLTKLPVVIKGVLRADDARQAVEHGTKALVVSNHGGRQLDTTPAAIDVLPRIAEAVDGKLELLLDGGVRRGTDVVKALALGAKAVMVGRPILWGLTVNGADGVQRVLHILRTELDTAMALCGCTNIQAITPDLIWKG